MKRVLIVILVFAILFAILFAIAVAASVSAAPDEARKPICGWVRKSPCWAEPMGGVCYIKRCR